jgi:hypothetical protein
MPSGHGHETELPARLAGFHWQRGTLQELRIECFFLMDEVTSKTFRQWSSDITK